MSGIYEMLAPYYDDFNADVDYRAWAEELNRLIRLYQRGETHRIIDLGCGTGGFTLPLAALGYEVTGIDLSPSMLSIAYDRAVTQGLASKVFFTEQDMTDFSCADVSDAAVCCLDGINHLMTTDDVSACFSSVAASLRADGLFLFDVHTKYKFEEILDGNSFVYENEHAFCIWQNAMRRDGACRFDLTLFEKGADGRYTRYDETQFERLYATRTLRRLLTACGFCCLAVLGNPDGRAPSDTDERLFFVARKNG